MCSEGRREQQRSAVLCICISFSLLVFVFCIFVFVFMHLSMTHFGALERRMCSNGGEFGATLGSVIGAGANATAFRSSHRFSKCAASYSKICDTEIPLQCLAVSAALYLPLR